MKWWYAGTSSLSLYGFQMCVSLCLCVYSFALMLDSKQHECFGSKVCAGQTQTAGLISCTHKQITKSCFSSRGPPLYSLRTLIDAASLESADIRSGYLAPRSQFNR